MEKIYVNIASMPSRLKYLRKYLPNILNITFSFEEIEKICLTYDDDIDDNTFASIKEEFENLDKRIKVIKGNHNLRVINKERGILDNFGDNITFITLDDDAIYQKSYINDLLEVHKKFPDKIICIDSNIIVKNGSNLLVSSSIPPLRNIKIQSAPVKFFSVVSLFPKGIFKETRIYDDKFIIDNNFIRNDELFISGEMLKNNKEILTINSSVSVCEDINISTVDNKKESDERFINKNCCMYYASINDWNKIFTKVYGIDIIKNKTVNVYISNEDALDIINKINDIKAFYKNIGYGVKFVFDNLTPSYKKILGI